jgi:hypothetical protein
MTQGTDECDELCAFIREKTHAKGTVLIVFEGEHGNAYSQQWLVLPSQAPELLTTAAAVLRHIAGEMDADAKKLSLAADPNTASS